MQSQTKMNRESLTRISNLGGVDLSIAVCEALGYEIRIENNFRGIPEKRLCDPDGKVCNSSDSSMDISFIKWNMYKRAIEYKTIPCYHGDIKAALSLVGNHSDFALWVDLDLDLQQWCAKFNYAVGMPKPLLAGASRNMTDPQTAVCKAFLISKLDPTA